MSPDPRFEPFSIACRCISTIIRIDRSGKYKVSHSGQRKWGMFEILICTPETRSENAGKLSSMLLPQTSQ
jgi:hypothetical protein